MFGFLRGEKGDRAYRQVYATCCAEQQFEFGLRSLPFVSYEAIFLRLFALDAQIIPPPLANSPTCCRLRRKRPEAGIDQDIAKFCSSFALLLATIKLEDDVQDDRSLVA